MKLLWNRARARREGDDGFTLVELLVVVVIIGILVAIAIPVFLSQREKAWASASESDLRNAAPIAEEWFASNGTYASIDMAAMNTSPDVTLKQVSGDTEGYCLLADHGKLDDTQTFYLDSDDGVVSTTPCS